MAENAVKFTFFGNQADAERAIVQLEKKYADLENKIRAVSRSTKREKDGVLSGLANWAGGLKTIAAGYTSMPAIIQAVIATNRELIESYDAAAEKYDELQRRQRVQAGRTPEEAGLDVEKVFAAAVKFGVADVKIAGETAVQLAGAGFSQEEATGKALETLLAARAGTNTKDLEDPGRMAKAIAMYLNAQGLAKTGDNLERVVVAAQRMFSSGMLEFSDFEQFAGKSTGLSGRATMDEQIAAFATMRNQTNADVAATAIKLIGSRLQTVREVEKREQVLGRMGLKPEDVDLVGESFTTALERLRKGYDALPEEMKSGTLLKLFGEEAVSGAKGLLDGLDDFRKLKGQAGDRAAFERDVEAGTSGRNIAGNRQKLIAERRAALAADETTLLLDTLQDMDARSGVSPLRRSVRRFGADIARGMGAEGETAAAFGFSSENIEEAKRMRETLMGGAETQEKLLAEIRDELKRARPAPRRNPPQE